MNNRNISRTTIVFVILAMITLVTTLGSGIRTQAADPTPTMVPTQILGGEGCAASAPKITWYVGLGSGGNPSEIEKEKAWVDTFNKAHPDTCVILQIVHNPESYDTLHAMIAAGTPPDIVGPVGKLGRENFRDAWTDVIPLAKAANFDLTKYDPTLLDFTKDNGVQVGLPFALFPAFIYYNKDLFDEAKLPYPPHKLGEKYQGQDWTIDAMTALAKKLTVDKNGADATDPKFDAQNVTQYGLWMGWSFLRRLTPMWGAGTPYEGKDTAKLPENWKAAWTWYYDAMWKDHIIPNTDATNSDVMAKGNPFSSGNVAMTYSFSWYTCCFDMKKLHWDVAVVPSYNGKITAGMNGDTFAIPKGSKNQELAFKVLSAMVVDRDLAGVYGGIPGNVGDRDYFFQNLTKQVGDNKVDWNVLLEMLKYPDIPNHEAWMPNMNKADALLNTFYNKLGNTPGLDMSKELDQLQKDLDAVFKAAQ